MCLCLQPMSRKMLWTGSRYNLCITYSLAETRRLTHGNDPFFQAYWIHRIYADCQASFISTLKWGTGDAWSRLFLGSQIFFGQGPSLPLFLFQCKSLYDTMWTSYITAATLHNTAGRLHSSDSYHFWLLELSDLSSNKFDVIFSLVYLPHYNQWMQRNHILYNIWNEWGSALCPTTARQDGCAHSARFNKPAAHSEVPLWCVKAGWGATDPVVDSPAAE